MQATIIDNMPEASSLGGPATLRADSFGDSPDLLSGRLRCSQVWGGIEDVDLDMRARHLSISLYSRAISGGCGGDIYYFSTCLSGGLTRIVLADVTGHGHEVSAVSQWLYEALAMRMTSLDGNAVLSDLNRAARTRGLDAITTATVIGFYPAHGALFCSHAGHPAPLVQRRGQRRWRSIQFPEHADPANIPLGVLDDPHYDLLHLPLRAGDRIFLFTDGLLEALDPHRMGDGLKRLRNVLERQAPNAPAATLRRGILAELARRARHAPAGDDITFAAVDVLPE